ncbi:MAG TPA: hypothetical protein VH879_12600 [Gemmatimonadales bacterium]
MSDESSPPNPAAPWLWRRDWSERRIRDQNRSGIWFLLLFSLFWNSIAWGVTIATWRGAPKRGPEHYLILLFPFLGVLLLVAALLAAIRRIRYGVAVLELATLPAPLGRALAGHVRIGSGLAPDREVSLRLRAIHRTVTGAGKNRRVRDEVVWEAGRTLPGAIPKDGGIVVPVAIPIPSDAPETATLNRNDRILWLLDVSSAVPGVDFEAQFEVPVFRTAESATPLTPEELARLR